MLGGEEEDLFLTNKMGSNFNIIVVLHKQETESYPIDLYNEGAILVGVTMFKQCMQCFDAAQTLRAWMGI